MLFADCKQILINYKKDITKYKFYMVLCNVKIMLKWIKNSKGAVTNKSSNYRGITQMKSGRYKATVLVRNKGTKAYAAYVGTYDSIKEAKKKRVEFILSLL